MKFTYYLSVSLIAAYLLLFLTFIAAIFYIQSIPCPNAPIDAVAVFTGGKGRIVAGVRTAMKMSCKKVFLSGVAKSTSMKAVKQRQLEDLEQMCDLDISIGREATDTEGNVIETIQWCKKNKLNDTLVMTSDYHIPRVWLEFKRSNEKIHFTFFPIQSSKHKIIFYKKCFREFNGCILSCVKFILSSAH